MRCSGRFSLLLLLILGLIAFWLWQAAAFNGEATLLPSWQIRVPPLGRLTEEPQQPVDPPQLGRSTEEPQPPVDPPQLGRSTEVPHLDPPRLGRSTEVPQPPVDPPTSVVGSAEAPVVPDEIVVVEPANASTGKAEVVRLGPVSLAGKTRAAIRRDGPRDPCSRRNAKCESIGRRDFSDIAFAILTDPALWSRTESALRTWLSVKTFATWLMFGEANREAALGLLKKPHVQQLLNKTRAQVHYIVWPPEVAGPDGAWKIFPTIALLHRRFLAANVAQRPRWYCIADDDTFLLGPNVARAITAAAPAHPALPAYLGHRALNCPYCRTKSKRYWFVFGGNGIFLNNAMLSMLLSRSLVLATPNVRTPQIVAAHHNSTALDMCSATYTARAGDERLGGCIRDLGVAVSAAEGGCEGFFAALAEGAVEFVNSSLFPYSFHRINRPGLAEALWPLVEGAAAAAAASGSLHEDWSDIITWPDVATWFAVPSAAACTASPHAIPFPANQSSSTRCLPIAPRLADWYPKQYDPIFRELERQSVMEIQRRQIRQRRRGPFQV